MNEHHDQSDASVKPQWSTPVLMSTDITRETVFMGGPNDEAQGRPDS